MWRRSQKITGSFLHASSWWQTRVPLHYFRHLSSSSIRQDHPNGGYFQNGGTPYWPSSRGQISSGSTTGPIYVLPNVGQNSHQGGQGREASKVMIFFSGLFLGASLAGVGLAVALTIINRGVKSTPHHREEAGLSKRKSIIWQASPVETTESNSEDDGGEDPESEYAEHDGTETHRVRREPGQHLPPAEILALEKDIVLQKLWNLRETVDKDANNAYTQSLLDSANASQLRIHMALISLITGQSPGHVFLDNALLESRPLHLKDESLVRPEKASLIRVVDAEGKNKLIMLGVDLDWHESNRDLASRFPAGSYGLDQWLVDLANDFERRGQNASDLTIFLYSNRVIVDVNHATGNSWVTRYRQSDFPPGFPLAQMRQIKKASDPKSNVMNLSKVEAPGPGKDAS